MQQPLYSGYRTRKNTFRKITRLRNRRLETTDDKLHKPSFLRNLLAYLESIWNRTCISNPVSDSDTAASGRSEGSFQLSTENISKRLQSVGEGIIHGGLDEKIPANVPESDKLTNMSKYEVEIPLTREETLAKSVFQWVKTERAGDISQFKEILLENGVEYIVFQDNTRVNSALIGDVVLQNVNSDETLLMNDAFEKISPPPVINRQAITPSPARTVNAHEDKISPVTSILDKSKKKKKKIQFEFVLEIPSAEVLSIIKENFEASDDELFDYFVSKLDKKKFVASVISSSMNK